MGESTVPRETYSKWVPASEAYLALLDHFNDGEATRSSLTRRLSGGILMSAAQVSILHDSSGGQQRIAFPFILPEMWERIAVGKDSHLWVISDVDFDLRAPGRYRELEDESYLSFIGVRFDRDGLNDIAPIFSGEDSPVPATEIDYAPPERKPALAEAESRRFATLYLEIWKSQAVEGKALNAVRACYPENSVGRDAFFAIFREMRGPGKRGNPTFRGE